MPVDDRERIYSRNEERECRSLVPHPPRSFLHSDYPPSAPNAMLAPPIPPSPTTPPRSVKPSATALCACPADAPTIVANVASRTAYPRLRIEHSSSPTGLNARAWDQLPRRFGRWTWATMPCSAVPPEGVVTTQCAGASRKPSAVRAVVRTGGRRYCTRLTSVPAGRVVDSVTPLMSATWATGMVDG